MTGHRMLKVQANTAETPSTMTMRFDERIDAAPGQFVMVWVPGVDEFPMSLSHVGERFGFTYQVVGDGTRALASKQPGDIVGVRGPYGRPYPVLKGRILVVAGGTGMASLAPYIERVARGGASVDLAVGARTANELLFEERCRSAGATVNVSTDDGSKGAKGFATILAQSLVCKADYDVILACGPEPMITGIVKLARDHDMDMYASLERYMKCGIGVCDSCAVDGLHVCTDGPVFSLGQLEAMGDLGKWKLDRCGARIRL